MLRELRPTGGGGEVNDIQVLGAAGQSGAGEGRDAAAGRALRLRRGEAEGQGGAQILAEGGGVRFTVEQAQRPAPMGEADGIGEESAVQRLTKLAADAVEGGGRRRVRSVGGQALRPVEPRLDPRVRPVRRRSCVHEAPGAFDLASVELHRPRRFCEPSFETHVSRPNNP